MGISNSAVGIDTIYPKQDYMLTYDNTLYLSTLRTARTDAMLGRNCSWPSRNQGTYKLSLERPMNPIE
jgi:hypothetical protein